MPWQPDRVERLAQGLFFGFDRLHFDGRNAVRDVIRHPGGVSVLPIRGDTITLIRQYRVAIGRTLLEAPAGKLEPGEAPDVAARRECVEEVGLRPDGLVPLGAMESSPGFTDELIHLYLAYDAIPTDSAPDGAEEVEAEVVEMTLAAAMNAIEVGDLSDGKTQVLVLSAWARQFRSDAPFAP